MSTLAVLTFNTWAMPLASKDTDVRLRHFCDYVRTAGTSIDLMLLQEVWTDEFSSMIADAAAAAGMVHALYDCFKAGAGGSGLMVLSRFPVEEADFRPFQVKGLPGSIEGEAMAGKGLAYVRVALPNGRSAHLLNTHTHANWVHSYDPDPRVGGVKVPSDHFAPFRCAHAVDLITHARKVVALAAARDDPVIAGGDFNVPHDHLEMVLFAGMTGLQDAWQAAGHDPFGVATCGDTANVYTGSIIGGYVPERIDYVWASPSLKVLSCETVLKAIPGTSLNYSDHYAQLATLGLPRREGFEPGAGGAVAGPGPEPMLRPASPVRAGAGLMALAPHQQAHGGHMPPTTSGSVPAASYHSGASYAPPGAKFSGGGGGPHAAAAAVAAVRGGGAALCQLLGHVQAKLRAGRAESEQRQRRARVAIAVAALTWLLAAGCVLYATFAPAAHPPPLPYVLGAVGTIVLCVSGLYGFFQLATGVVMDRALQYGFTATCAAVDVWVAAAKAATGGGGGGQARGGVDGPAALQLLVGREGSGQRQAQRAPSR